VTKIWANLFRFGQNQNLTSPQNIRSPTAMATGITDALYVALLLRNFSFLSKFW